jgi:hypothetical protein
MMVVSAASISTSLTPAASVWPTGLEASIWISKVQAVVLEQHGGRCGGFAVVADQLRGVAQAAAGAALEGDLQCAVTMA